MKQCAAKQAMAMVNSQLKNKKKRKFKPTFSGNSQNVLNGVKVARAKGAITVGFIGFDGGKLKDLVNIPLVVSNNNIEQVEDIHLLLGHVITTCLRRS
jgi:D-sedoheptulose 7-phosphate isomerase